MNSVVKFHKPNGPAFNKGEEWRSVSGNIKCFILSVVKIGSGKFNYRVNYRYADGKESWKDAWSFQVRYRHVADKNLKRTPL